MLVDLSISLDAQTPTYPGDPPLVITETSAIGDGCQLHSVTLGTHVGTHIDAPAHMINGGDTLGQLPLEQFVGSGTYIDATNGDITVAQLEAAHLVEGAIVIFHTGTYLRLHNPSYFSDYPVLSQEVADYLVACNVKLVGLDTCSSDNTESFPIHKTLLGAGIAIIENLTNLAALAGKQFTLYALPLKLNLDGAPARVVAEVREP